MLYCIFRQVLKSSHHKKYCSCDVFTKLILENILFTHMAIPNIYEYKIMLHT